MSGLSMILKLFGGPLPLIIIVGLASFGGFNYIKRIQLEKTVVEHQNVINLQNKTITKLEGAVQTSEVALEYTRKRAKDNSDFIKEFQEKTAIAIAERDARINHITSELVRRNENNIQRPFEMGDKRRYDRCLRSLRFSGLENTAPNTCRDPHDSSQADDIGS